MSNDIGLPPFVPTERMIAQLIAQVKAQEAEAASHTVPGLNLRVEEIMRQTTDLDNQIKSTAPKKAADTITALEYALTKVYKLAVFIRGDYDSRDEDVDAEFRKTIFAQATGAFQSCDAIAQAGLKQLGDVSVQVTALQTNKMAPLRAELEAAQVQNKIDLESIKSQEEEAMRNQAIWAEQYRAAVSAVDQAQKDQADIGNQITTGFILAWQFATGDTAAAAATLSAAQMKLQAAKELREQGQAAVTAAQQKSSELRDRHMSLNNIDHDLPLLTSNLNIVYDQATKLMEGFISLKKDSTKMVLLAKEMENRAVVTMKMAYKKSMFASGLLKLCRTALVDPKVEDEVQMIRNEISDGYQGLNMPAEVGDLLSEIQRLSWPAPDP